MDTSIGNQAAIDQKRRKYPFSTPVIVSVLAAIESLALIAIGFTAQLILVGWPEDILEYYLFAIFFVFFCTIILLRLAGQYHFDSIFEPIGNVDKLVVACLTAFLLLLAIAFSLKISDTFSRKWMFVFAFSNMIAIIAGRLVFASILVHLSKLGILSRNVVVLGSGVQANRLLKRITDEGAPFVMLLGVFDPNDRAQGSIENIPVLGNLDDLVAFVRAGDVDDVIIATPWSEEGEIVSQVEKLLELPIKIYLASDLIGFRYDIRPASDNYSTLPVSELVDKPLPGWAYLVKYLEDKILALLILIIFSPVMLLTAIAVKLDSPGPVFYRQDRLGFNNRRFSIYKFRSMHQGDVPLTGTPQATVNDPRITRVGRFIRRTSIDELPQLFNVLIGTMSLVGPRPHALDHNIEYSRKIRGYFARHRVRPGITGWAQANGYRGETSDITQMEARIRHDIYYAQNWSLLFDIKILIMTAWIVIRGENAY